MSKIRRTSLLGPEPSAYPGDLTAPLPSRQVHFPEALGPDIDPGPLDRLPPPLLPAVPPLAAPVPSVDESAQVMLVLNNAADRVAQEAVTQAIQSAPGPAQVHTQAVLAKQQQVLSVTAKVIQHEAHNALVADSRGEPQAGASMLAQAAQAVVHQAAKQIQADKTAVAMMHAKDGAGPAAMPTPISVTDVSIATQSAVAHAVAITGSQSSEVEVMLTASNLIQQRSRADSTNVMPTAMPAANYLPQSSYPSLGAGTSAASPNGYAQLVPPSSYMR